MRIVFFGNAPVSNAAIRYRVVKFATMFESEGHECVVCLPSGPGLRERLWNRGNRWTKLAYLFLQLGRRFAQLRHVPGADVVFFRGPVFPYGPPLFERIIHAINPRMVFDIDDAIWEPPAHVDSPFLRFVDFGWVRKMSAMCAHAIVGNNHLAAYVRPLNPKLTIVPTCIDMEKHRAKIYGDSEGPVVLGWTGLKNNLGHLEIIAPVLQALAKAHPFRLSVASGEEYHLEGVDVENHYWNIKHEIDYLANADIGIMPLKDTPRARGKCAFKALQHMGVGTPSVISPVGMNAEVIEDGVDGFLANTPQEWKEKLERLILEPQLRRRMGEAARKTVQERYSHEANYPKIKAAFEMVAALKR